MFNRKIRLLETVHIPMWILKDTCWMMQWWTPAIFMIIPTVGMALWIAWITRASRLFFLPNLAVCCWIAANATWMLGEYLVFDFTWPSLIFFITGLIAIVWYFILHHQAGESAREGR
jgi:hypothetical protein